MGQFFSLLTRKGTVATLLWVCSPWAGPLLAADDTQKPSANDSPTFDQSETQSPGRTNRTTEWEVLFADGISMKEYAEQLDYFEIEIGVEDNKGKIQYAAHLTRNKPERRSGSKQEERRISTRWKTGTLPNFDRKLLSRVGIGSQGKTLVHYYSPQVEHQMFELEKDYGGHDMHEIRRTRFKIRPTESGEGYEFFVVEQELQGQSPGESPQQSTVTVKPKKAAGK